MKKRILCMTDHPRVYAFAKAIFADKGIKATWAQSPCGDKVCGLSVRNLKDPIEIDAIVKNYALVLSLHCKQIFPPELAYGTRCVNFHPGFNPINRGWFPSQFSIADGRQTGVTIHEIDAGIDSGKVIDRRAVNVESWDTSETVYEKIMRLEELMLDEWLPVLVSGEYESVKVEDGNYNSIKDYDEFRQLDLNEPCTVRDVIDHLRALTHGKYKNAYFIDDTGRKVWARISLEPDQDNG